MTDAPPVASGTAPTGPPVGAPGRLLGSPGANPPTAPPPAIPLSFLAASGVGLVGFGVLLALGADLAVVYARYTSIVGAVHVGLLAFLTTAVLGALHQFAPVVGVAPLRSVRVAWVTAVLWITGAWLLPQGFAHGPESLIQIGGSLAFTAVLLAAWNVSKALTQRDKGTPIVGLRLSVFFLVATASFGIVYAFDRQEGWFPLLNERVLAHAHLGLLGWMGLTYVAVAEKLWPMFLLAHRPSERSGAWAIRLLAAGVSILVPGLLFAWEAVGIVGGVLVAGGVAAHLVSLASVLRHRRRRLELLHGFILAAAVALVAAVVIGAVAALAPVSTTIRMRLVSAEVASLFAWLTLAVVGHVHKIVPFIVWGRLRAAGIKKRPDGRQLMFSDLFDARVARATFVLAVAGCATLVVGFLVASEPTVATGALVLSVTGVVALSNLGFGPRRAAKACREVAAAAERSASRPRIPVRGL